MRRSIVNHECKVTLTCYDECQCSKNLLNLMYLRSPYRTSDVIAGRLKKSPADLVDTIPTKYVMDLDKYKHFLFTKPTILRLSNYFSKNTNNNIYSVTTEYFPTKVISSFDEFINFVVEAHPDNLIDELKKYPRGNFINISFDNYQKDVLFFGETLGLNLNDYNSLDNCNMQALECLPESLSLANEYYEG